MTQLWDLTGIAPNHSVVVPGDTIPAMFWNAVKLRGPDIWMRQKHLGACHLLVGGRARRG